MPFLTPVSSLDGLLLSRRIPQAAEPERPRTLWDLVLEGTFDFSKFSFCKLQLRHELIPSP